MDAAHEPERKGDLAVAADLALIGFFKACHHVDQGGLAGAVRRQHTQRFAGLNTERHAVKDHLALGSCPKGLADVFKLKHRLFRYCPCGPVAWLSQLPRCPGACGAPMALSYQKSVNGLRGEFGLIMSNCDINHQPILNHFCRGSGQQGAENAGRCGLRGARWTVSTMVLKQ